MTESRHPWSHAPARYSTRATFRKISANVDDPRTTFEARPADVKYRPLLAAVR